MKKTNDITQEKLADVFKAERAHLLRYACYRLGNEDDAKDVLQDTFLKLHTRIADADDLQINNLRSYIFRTLTNICAKWQTLTNRVKTIQLDKRIDVVETSDHENEVDYRRIVHLLTEIPDEQAEVIRLRIYGDNSFAEVAEILSLPLPTVKSRFLYGLEKLRKGIFPERLLTIQKSAIKLSNENKVTQMESDSTIVLTVDGVEKNSDLRQLFETGKMDDCRLIVENTFTKNDGLLRFVKLWVIKDDKKILLLHIDNIRYNVMLNKGEITRLPTAEWTDITEQRATSSNRLKQLQNETPQQAAKRILNAIIADKDSQAAEALIYYKSILPQLIHKLKGCKVSAFETRKDSSYVSVYVFYTLTTPEGNREKRHIAIRNDNEQHIWIVDGGL